LWLLYHLETSKYEQWKIFPETKLILAQEVVFIKK